MLDIAPVVSADNGADAPSRNKPLDLVAAARCLQVMKDHQQGHGRAADRTLRKIEFTGGLRHKDASDDEDDVECELMDLGITEQVYDE